MTTFEITHRHTGSILYSGGGETLRDVVVSAVKGGADLRGADLDGADLDGANLPSPTMTLMASWGSVSDLLCRDLMNFDAACHPNPLKFEAWAKGGECPYQGEKVQRAAIFSENRLLWDATAPMCRPYDLMVRLMGEKCPAWTDAKQAEFQARFTTEHKP